MASVTQVGGKWRALIRRKGHAAQCKTFPTKAQAMAWARQVEGGIDSGQVAPELPDLTIRQVLTAYRKLRADSRPIKDTSNEHYQLKTLDRCLGDMKVAQVTPETLVSFAVLRTEEGAGPYTVNMDISKLGTAMRYGAVALRVVLPDIVGTARPLLTHLRLIGGGGKRERRPTEDEMDRILEHLRKGRGAVYADAVAFAASSAMRRGEICALMRADVNEETRVVPVWRKHPRKGQVLEKVPLLPDSWEIIKRQPESEDGRIFPIHPGTLSKYFTESCRELGIPDLHLHDMRHEGVSNLFEEGYQIQEVALVSGHKSWNMLKRYTNLRPEDLTRRATGSGQSELPSPDSPHTSSPNPSRSSRGTSRH